MQIVDMSHECVHEDYLVLILPWVLYFIFGGG